MFSRNGIFPPISRSSKIAAPVEFRNGGTWQRALKGKMRAQFSRLIDSRMWRVPTLALVYQSKTPHEYNPRIDRWAHSTRQITIT